MRTTIFSTATILFLALCNIVSAQKTITWKGGTPGQENEWNCSKNWNTNTVPNDFSNVVIPDVSSSTKAFPVIYTSRVEVNAIIIASNALLTVERNAELIVFEQAEGLEGIRLLLKGTLVVPGNTKASTREGLQVNIPIEPGSIATEISTKL